MLHIVQIEIAFMLTILFNLNYKCTELKNVIMANKNLIKTVQSDSKYKRK